MPSKQLSSAPSIRGDVKRHCQSFPCQSKSLLSQKHEHSLLPDTSRYLKMHQKGRPAVSFARLPLFRLTACQPAR